MANTTQAETTSDGPSGTGADSRQSEACNYVVPRLQLMMFLEYAVKGIWFPLASFLLTAPRESGGLGFTQNQKGMIIGLPLAIGAISAPFLAGQLADRFFSTQKCLAVMLILAGVIKWVTASQTTFAAWLMLSVVYAMLYVPTMSLSNSLALAHLPEPRRQFPLVRVWGTVGWIAVSWAFAMLWLQHDLKPQWAPPFLKGIEHGDVTGRMLDSLRCAGVLAVVLGIYCWCCLPDTPPNRSNQRKLAFVPAFAMLRNRSFSVLLLVTLIISVIHTLYFVQMAQFLQVNGLDRSELQPAMSVGQFSEILVMALTGFALTRLGYRRVMQFGILAYVVRYGIFGIPGLPVAAYIVAHALHGFCFAWFFATAFVYVDRLADADIRNSVQTLYTLVFMGLGPAIAALLNGPLVALVSNSNASLDAAAFARYWQVTAMIGLVAVVVFAALFRDETALMPTETAA